MIPPISTVSLFVCVSVCICVWEPQFGVQIHKSPCLHACVHANANHLAWRKQLLCSLRVKWANNYRRGPSLESVYNSNKGECQWQKMSCLLHKYNTTLPFWSELRAGQTYKWLPCFHRSTHTQPKPNKTNHPHLNLSTQTKRHAHARTQNKNIVVLKNGWCQSRRHVRADTSWVTHCCLQARAAVLASYGTAATEDKDSLHVVFTQPWRLLLVLCVWKWECEVAVRLHLPKIKRRSFWVFFTHLTFTGVYAVFLSHCCSSTLCMYTFPILSIFGWDNCKGARVQCDFCNEQILISSLWDMVSVFSKFYNDKDKAITKVTLNFNKLRFQFLIYKTSLHLEHHWGGNISSLIKHNFVWGLSLEALRKQMLSCHVSNTVREARINFILFS